MIQYRNPFKKRFTRELIHLLSIVGNVSKNYFFSPFYGKEISIQGIEQVIEDLCVNKYIRLVDDDIFKEFHHSAVFVDPTFSREIRMSYARYCFRRKDFYSFFLVYPVAGVEEKTEILDKVAFYFSLTGEKEILDRCRREYSLWFYRDVQCHSL